MKSTETLCVGSRRHEARSIVAASTRAVYGRESTFGAVRTSVGIGAHGSRRNESSGGRLASHCHWGRPDLAVDGVRAGETTGLRKEAVSLVGASADKRSGIRNLGRSTIDVLGPVFNLVLPLLLVASHAGFVSRKLAAEEPLEDQGEDELGSYDGQNEDEGNVEHHLGGNAANGLCVDRSDLDDFLQTLSNLLVGAGSKS